MAIEYQETIKDLLTRIDIHQKYGARDIDEWMLELLQPLSEGRILDVGCGAGKQCFLYWEKTGGKAEITGGDISQELLERARSENARRGASVKFIELDFNRRFPFEDQEFDLISCCFAIYYAEDVPFTLREMHRVLKPGGRLFTTGPMPENKKVFYDIIRAASGRPTPPMPGSSRYSSLILDTIRSLFSDVQVHIFENPLVFESVEPFLEYTRASLSEDRKLWTPLFSSKDEFEALMQAIEREARAYIAREGKLIMTKVVGGFIATK
uniref:Ubiquinone/menaquinone methyltransferase n=1 Tax=uncultured Chloroflexota bacterium TaxID=166587 RepID=H5SM45_9CHLR|nr:ubiquinone/menaquinone methyltransferase [uncultured Chloroflexota bacterium]BAL58049.1 ubiquinone/menaquinone methyltransferase [uncultured Chloroflexota bacterium]